MRLKHYCFLWTQAWKSLSDIHTFDVIIVGGGIVGLTAALGLANKTNCQVAVLDNKSLSSNWQIDKPSMRVSAITQLSKNIFSNLNIWPYIAERRLAPFTKISVYHESEVLSFASEDINIECLGHIIEDPLLRDACLEQLKSCLSVTLIDQVELKSLEYVESGILLKDINNINYRAKLVIAADGAGSWVRHAVNIETDLSSYRHCALVTTVQTELQHASTAHQRFLPDGPLAFLPLKNPHACSIVWSHPPEEIKRLQALPDQDFEQAIQQAFGEGLGKIKLMPEAKRLSFALNKSHAKCYVKDRVALVGDAAHTIHPLAGQGVNMGLLDVAALVDVLSEAVSKKRNIGSLHTLRKYERWRKADNALMLTAIDGLKSFFQSTSSFLKPFKKYGLPLTERSTILKNIFMHIANGERGPLPSLATKHKAHSIYCESK